MRIRIALVTAVIGAGIGLTVPGRALVGQDAEKKTFSVPHVLEALDQLIAQPVSGRLSVAEATRYTAETAWLKDAKQRIEALAVKHDIVAPRDAASGQASGRRMHNPLVMRQEFDALKATLEVEGRQFNTLSNASKARHDIAMNAIRNMKA